MALQKQTININFGEGLDTKTDPWQVKPGKFLSLQNAIFTKGGLLSKRNGYKNLPAITNSPSSITTFLGNLTAVGKNLQVLSQDTGTWSNRGSILPVDLSVVPVVRSSINIVSVDSAVASNGTSCSVYVDSNANAYYQISDSLTGQIIVTQTAMSGALIPRAFSIGNYFIITFMQTVTGTPHLRYISIPINNPSAPSASIDISSSVHSVSTGYDGVTSGGTLYVSWYGADVGGSIRSTFIDSQLNQHSTLVTPGYTADKISMTVDSTGASPVLWVTFWQASNSNAYTAAFSVSGQLAQFLNPTLTINAVTISNMTSAASGGVLTLFYATSSTYSYNSVRSDFITSVTCSTLGAVGAPSVVLRGVGISGKAFYLSSTATNYLLCAYSGSFQPVNFLIDSLGNVVAKLAYQNAGGYSPTQVIPNANVSGNSVTYGYLYKFLSVPVNPAQGVTAPGGIYGQTGINLASFSINTVTMISQEIAGSIHLTGGIVWQYDGNKPVEQNFHVFPEDLKVTTSSSGGSVTDQLYYYYAVYAWIDAAGNIHRSAPSIPYSVTSSGGNTSTNTVKVPTLRQTYKTGSNVVRIEIYRWSTAQQTPYLITSESSPTLNDTTADSITYVDTAADSSIIGSEILYTTGGTVEDSAPPASSISTLFKSRMFLVDAEDRNLLWFSKVVIESTPVEFSPLLTLYAAPTISSQGSTGPITALSAMDDKLILFKKDAIYYITGQGPDNTGANSDYGDPIFITSSVGCSNPQSIVLVPQGLMFQTDKGIWILGRDLSTSYIGAPVELYNSATVVSSITAPGTNQVRFTLNNGITLMYDYFYQQWGTFVGIPGVTSTVYQGLHTFLNSFGQVLQEKPGSYIDGASPVLMSFTTSWLNMTGLQGYQRAYEFYLLGQYLSPHKLQVQVGYDYSPSPTQQSIISPDNYNAAYGSDSPFGSGSPFGGNSQVEQWRIFFNRQTCESFQITVNELYDSSFKVPAGAGLTISGLDVVFGSRKGWPRLPSSRQIG